MTIYRRPRRWWQRRPKMRSERWDDVPAYRQRNDGWGACNTGANAKGVCSLGGIGCNVDHRLIWESGPRFPYLVERKVC